ncbi:MAG: hydrogenase maturation protease [Methylophilaceae bacterium]|nr:hydrogenase maturation protease [Methylophilaceae bacterium]
MLVLAVGNESRGDDALGPLLAREIVAWNDPRVEVIEAFQLQIEHTLDIQARELVLFIDAASGLDTPYRFSRAIPKPFDSHTSHAVAPEALLGIHRHVHHREPPPAYLLAVSGKHFELGAGLSDWAAHSLRCSVEFVRRLLEQPTAAAWQIIAQQLPT